MKKLKLFILFIPVLLLFQSCGDSKYPIQLGDVYYLTGDGSWGYPRIYVGNLVIIDMEIVAWNYDSIFIIAKQKPFRDIFDSLRFEYPNTSAKFRDKLYEETEIYNYWIIDKGGDFYWDEENSKRINESVKGPFTYEEYWEKRRELGVSDTLKLKKAEKMSFKSPIDWWIYERTNKDREEIVE